jgi:hypothetical protein
MWRRAGERRYEHRSRRSTTRPRHSPRRTVVTDGCVSGERREGPSRAHVLHRLSDDRKRGRGRGPGPGSLLPAPARPPERCDGRVAQGLLGRCDDSAGDRPHALGPRSPGVLCRHLASRADRRRPARKPRADRRAVRLPLHGVPRAARKPHTGRTGRVLAPRGIRLLLPRHRPHRRQERGQPPTNLHPGPATHTESAPPLRGVDRAKRGPGPVLSRRHPRRQPRPADGPAGRGRRLLRRRGWQGDGHPRTSRRPREDRH